MEYLLDTHTLLWAIQDSDKLSRVAIKYISDTENVCYFSIVSLWEITIKFALGTLDLKMSLEDCFEIITKTGFLELQIHKRHLSELALLPYLHKDPFDRMLIAQAILPASYHNHKRRYNSEIQCSGNLVKLSPENSLRPYYNYVNLLVNLLPRKLTFGIWDF